MAYMRWSRDRRQLMKDTLHQRFRGTQGDRAQRKLTDSLCARRVPLGKVRKCATGGSSLSSTSSIFCIGAMLPRQKSVTLTLRRT